MRIGREEAVHSTPVMKQEVTVDLIDLKRGVYVDEDGKELGPISKGLLKKCKQMETK